MSINDKPKFSYFFLALVSSDPKLLRKTEEKTAQKGWGITSALLASFRHPRLAEGGQYERRRYIGDHQSRLYKPHDRPHNCRLFQIFLLAALAPRRSI